MDFIESYQTILRELIQEQAESIAGGSCSTFDDYKFRIGFRKGLVHALDKFNDTLAKFVVDEDRTY